MSLTMYPKIINNAFEAVRASRARSGSAPIAIPKGIPVEVLQEAIANTRTAISEQIASIRGCMASGVSMFLSDARAAISESGTAGVVAVVAAGAKFNVGALLMSGSEGVAIVGGVAAAGFIAGAGLGCGAWQGAAALGVVDGSCTDAYRQAFASDPDQKAVDIAKEKFGSCRAYGTGTLCGEM